MADNNKKLEEANFEVSSLAEVKDEKGNGIFHMRTKTKFILLISIVILLGAGSLIFLSLEKIFPGEVWQMAIWGLCGALALYSIFARSIPAMLLNCVLFFGVSMIPLWQAGHETFKPVIEKFTSEPVPEVETEQPATVPEQTAEKNSEPEVVPAEKISEQKNSATDKVTEVEPETAPEQKLVEPDLPTI